MRRNRNLRPAVVVGLLAACLVAVPSSTAREPIPPPVGKAMVKKDIAYLQEKLETGPQRKDVGAVKATAMLLALYAQETGDGALRDQALKVAEAVNKRDFEAAKAAAAKLKPGGFGAVVPVNLHEKAGLSRRELMWLNQSPGMGGRSLEKEIRAQMAWDAPLDGAGEVAARTLLIGEYMSKMPPPGVGGDPVKQPKWDRYAAEEVKLARAILAESAKGAKADRVKVTEKFRTLYQNCIDCHKFD